MRLKFACSYGWLFSSHWQWSPTWTCCGVFAYRTIHGLPSVMKNATMKILIRVLGCTFVSISIFSICCCVTNSHRLQTTHIPQCPWVSSPNTAELGPLLQGFSQTAIKVSARAGSLLKSQLGKDLLPSSHSVGRIQFPEDCWIAGLSSYLAVGQRALLVTYHVGLSNIKACKPRRQ